MKRPQFTEDQIIAILRKARIDGLAPVVCGPQGPLIPATAFGISVGITNKGRVRR
ncbi:hypothetical protein SAMN05878503_11064 [Cereibacter ovatus]|uniref:Uncharacterized protein n=1 Tax=Cereibacter ovatus TaxID=439529 RepID=A0A285CXI2_9RHOB|nr:hypothetical protein [Cereibacter ovatus]SNX71653.1 hypothetical protein SAMN05878503_11064 [Cereibacter ovatus]